MQALAALLQRTRRTLSQIMPRTKVGKSDARIAGPSRVADEV
jgi:hypothetical protein